LEAGEVDLTPEELSKYCDMRPLLRVPARRYLAAPHYAVGLQIFDLQIFDLQIFDLQILACAEVLALRPN
jgi:gamma-glutamylcysteine synthetase